MQEFPTWLTATLASDATIGGLMALEMQNARIAGLVTDGLVRASAWPCSALWECNA
jgi:hypothetical protein